MVSLSQDNAAKAAAQADEIASLRFASSESKMVGASGGLMDKLRANSPRVVGMLKLPGDMSVSIINPNPFLICYTVLACIARIIMIMYGTKANQAKVADELGNESGAEESIWGKITNPSKYPVESSAAISTVAEAFGLAYGVSMFMAGGTGFTPIVVGLIAVWAYSHILLGKEGKDIQKTAEEQNAEQQSLVFASSQSKDLGWWGGIQQKMKENPVFSSSITNLGVSAFMIIGGLLESGLTAYAVAGCLFAIGNAVQAMLVTKRGFNIEGAKEAVAENPNYEESEKDGEKQSGQRFTERLASQRKIKDSNNGFGTLAPA